MRLLFTAELGGTRSTSCSSQRALSLVMKLGGGLPLKNFTCICVFAIESMIILILYCRCNFQYYLSDLHASVCLHVYIVSVQCCGITSTVEQLPLKLLTLKTRKMHLNRPFLSAPFTSSTDRQAIYAVEIHKNTREGRQSKNKKFTNRKFVNLLLTDCTD